MRQPAAPGYRTKRDFAIQSIREAIVSGELEPGQHVRQEELARRLGISATPIREAIGLLEAEGLLRNEPHKGVTVVALAPDDIVETYWIRSGLESVATRLAVLNTSPQRRKDLVNHLSSIHAAMEAAVVAGNLKRVPRQNRDFHFAIFDAAGMPRLRDMIQRLWVNLPHYYLWQIPGRAETSLAQHVPILQAISSGDADAAEAAMRQHICLALNTLVQSLAETGALNQRGVPTPSRS